MTTEQRRALAATIPTTEVIRDAVTFPRDRLGEPLDISPERFDAWLARVRRDAAREALAGFGAEWDGLDILHPREAALDYAAHNYPEETPPERDEWRQTALDERAAALDALEQVKAREARVAEEKRLRMKATAAATKADARIKAVRDVLERAGIAESYMDTDPVGYLRSIRRALDGDA